MIPNEISANEKSLLRAADRYHLTRTAQALLWVREKGWPDQHRTCWCSRSLKRVTETIDAYRNETRDGSSLDGLNRCGNVHTCPVCAAKISEPRRKELQSGMVRHVEGNGGAAYLLNFTFPHEADEPLAELLPKFIQARMDFQKCRDWKAFQKYAGNITIKRTVKGEKREVITVGVVNSLEFTVSLENGWHPHLHMLVFCKRKGFGDEERLDEDGNLTSALIERLKKAWVKALFKAGLGDQAKLTDMLKHGLVIRGGEKAADYIAKFGRDEKWGASSELARAHSKIGAAGERYGILHFTPFQLLEWIAAADRATQEGRDTRAWCTAKFREYAAAVEGKKALVWAPNLKDALGVTEASDEELADDKPLQVHVGTLTADQFSVIVRKHALPDFLLHLVSCDNQEHIDEFLDWVKDKPDRGSGALLVKKWIGGGRIVLFNHGLSA